MSETSAIKDLRTQMPKVAQMIERRRLDWGKDYVNGCIRRGMAGEGNCFFASEAGHSVGTPFTGPVNDEVAWYMVTFGVDAMLFIKQPEVRADV
ncbi:MAG: hypothetical protein J7605_02620 [Variovorax sp.]|nr:hypothetical protein [Variovorax sp.]